MYLPQWLVKGPQLVKIKKVSVFVYIDVGIIDTISLIKQMW